MGRRRRPCRFFGPCGRQVDPDLRNGWLRRPTSPSRRAVRLVHMLRTRLLPIALAAAVVVPTVATTTAATAAIKNPQADAAMRKGIRDVAGLEGNGAKAVHIK